jgi:hypothetical protein
MRYIDHDAGGPSDIYSAVGKIPGPPAWLARRGERNLARLSSLVPPRVCAAVFRTVWNGWCTARRYQRLHEPCNRCWLGCEGEAQDSIEHYCRCPIGLSVLLSKLRLDLNPGHGLSLFCLCAPEQRDDDLLTVSALYIYAVYMCSNHYRHKGHVTADRAKQALGQYIIQSCEGDPKLIKFLDGRWMGRPL